MNLTELYCKFGLHNRHLILHRYVECINELNMSKTIDISVWGCVNCGHISYYDRRKEWFMTSYPLVESLLTKREKEILESFKANPGLINTYKEKNK